MATKGDSGRSEAARLRSLLIRVLPECEVCPECGPFAKIDEDGCCVQCGADTSTQPSERALAVMDGGGWTIADGVRALSEHVVSALKKAEEIKWNVQTPSERKDRAQAQADAYRVVMALMRDWGLVGSNDETWREVWTGVVTGHEPTPILCPLDRSVLDFEVQTTDERRYRCQEGHTWAQQGWRGRVW